MNAWLPPPSQPELAPGELHLWRVSLSRPPAPLWRFLSAGERQKASSFVFERDRDRYVVGRGNVRLILGRYLDCSPAEIQFVQGRYGKPAVEGPIRFNVSHSDDLLLCAVAPDFELGVDIERIRPERSLLDIAVRYFSPAERAELQGMSQGEQLVAFFRGWTRKEAYLKATGEGLHRLLDQFTVSLSDTDPHLVLDGPHRWHLQDVHVEPGYAAAVATEGRPERTWYWVTPAR